VRVLVTRSPSNVSSAPYPTPILSERFHAESAKKGPDDNKNDSGYGGIVASIKTQLLKWVGSKQRFAGRIIACFPGRFGTYHEPFLGSGAVLAALAPPAARASDCFAPLIDIWSALKDDPERLIGWYAERWARAHAVGKQPAYAEIRDSFNARPNGADLVWLSRACYGGVVRFRRADGAMSTPCGAHDPIPPAAFARRVAEWRPRVAHAEFRARDFREAMAEARAGDLVYCDPPYNASQPILYGAQGFSLGDLFAAIEECRRRGVAVALSLDGTKKSGRQVCEIPIPDGLFAREVMLDAGRSMLRRFQMGGESLEREVVADRLLLTY
jgi:DNA adenine methylase